MENNIIQILVQGGLTSALLVSLYVNWKIVTNHMNHSREATTELIAVIRELKQYLKDKLNGKNY